MQVEISDKVITLKSSNSSGTVIIACGSIQNIETAGALNLNMKDGKLFLTDDAKPARPSRKKINGNGGGEDENHDSEREE